MNSIYIDIYIDLCKSQKITKEASWERWLILGASTHVLTDPLTNHYRVHNIPRPHHPPTHSLTHSN